MAALTEQHTQFLFDKYPDLFAGRHEPATQSLMCYGFECGDGWFRLLDDLCDTLTRRAAHRDIKVKAVQVKEKFGGLRFYFDCTPGPSWTIVDRFRRRHRLLRRFLAWCRDEAFPWWPGLRKQLGRLEYWLSRRQNLYIRTLPAGKTWENSYDQYRAFALDPLYDIVHFFEQVSFHVCEDCGRYGTKRAPGGWIAYLCDECLSAREKE